MSGGPVIDSVEFAKSGGSRSGEFALAKFERLKPALFDAAGHVRYALDGFVNGEGKPSLHLRVDGRIKLTCQRCLGPLEFILGTNREFVLVGSEQDLQDVAEESALIDHIPADPKLDVAEFVESEILLDLPMAPLHQPGACESPKWGSRAPMEDKAFGALEALKKRDS